MRIRVRKSVAEFIQQTASYIDSPDGIYYYIPFWFKKVDEEDTFEEYSFDKLPQELKDIIKAMRENEK